MTWDHGSTIKSCMASAPIPAAGQPPRRSRGNGPPFAPSSGWMVVPSSAAATTSDAAACSGGVAVRYAEQACRQQPAARAPDIPNRSSHAPLSQLCSNALDDLRRARRHSATPWALPPSPLPFLPSILFEYLLPGYKKVVRIRFRRYFGFVQIPSSRVTATGAAATRGVSAPAG